MAKKKVKKEKEASAAYDGSKPLKDKQQETFCALYSTAGHYFFGNATYSYAEAYGKMERLNEIDEQLEKADNTHQLDEDGDRIDDGPTEYQELKSERKSIMAVCGSNGWRLLKNADIRLRAEYYLRMYLSENSVDAARAFIINQREDLRAAQAAIGDYDKVLGRIKKPDVEKPDKVFIEFSWLDPEPRPDAGKSRPKAIVKTA